MDDSKRIFLKTSGLGLVGLGCGIAPFATALAEAEEVTAFRPTAEALKASRWAMVIDTKKCAQQRNCGACAAACHAAHNVPTIKEERHEVKWIWKEKYRHAFPTQIHDHTNDALRTREMLVLCNHCNNPPCVRVCPTGATWKRSDGLVMMDMHRCVGCRFCVVGCPYGSRSFNWKKPDAFITKMNPEYPHRAKGVVEKCSFCAERLAKGKIPICVEACKGAGVGALAFGDLGDPGSEVSRLLRDSFSIRRKPNLGTAPHVFYLV